MYNTIKEDSSTNFEIVTNVEEISFKKYMDRLYEIAKDCNQEVYYSEIFIPFLRMCCMKDTKIIPTFDDRNTGRKSDNLSSKKQQMRTICAPKENGGYVVPDYIFVPKKYSYITPCKPYLMVETKCPIFPIFKNKVGIYYEDLEKHIKNNEQELTAEIKACGCVVFTDGIIWMFLVLNERNEIVEHSDFKAIRLVEQFDYHYNARRIERKVDKEWNKLKETIKNLVEKQVQRDNS